MTGEGWRFPTGLIGAFDVRDSPTAVGLLQLVDAWRPEAGAALARDSGPWLSDGLRDVLLQALAVRPSLTLTTYPYRLQPFPGAAGQPVVALRRVLLWRAGVVDFLADVWDTLGPAPFTMDDCVAAGRVFEPADLADGHCHLCLGPLPATVVDHFPGCPVQVAWGHGEGRRPRVDGPRRE